MGFAMVGIMLVCIDVGVAAASVGFAIRGMMFVCMDVGVASAYVGFAVVVYDVCVHGCRSCRCFCGVRHRVV